MSTLRVLLASSLSGVPFSSFLLHFFDNYITARHTNSLDT
jgi:hypothetical protein